MALIEDYNTLYKDNATLKSKMRVLVEKLEEYRAEEGGAKENLRAAQQTCDAMIREAEAKCLKMLHQAEAQAPNTSLAEAKTAAREDRSPGDAAEGDLGKAGGHQVPGRGRFRPAGCAPDPERGAGGPGDCPKSGKAGWYHRGRGPSVPQ